jgi:hypothetical protein
MQITDLEPNRHLWKKSMHVFCTILKKGRFFIKLCIDRIVFSVPFITRRWSRRERLSFHLRKSLFVVAALSSAFTVNPAYANDTMDVLLAGKQLKVTTASGASFTVAFNANGQYQTSAGATGTWTLDGDALCTTRTGLDVSNCGKLPSGKVLGDAWTTTDANGNTITVSIV